MKTIRWLLVAPLWIAGLPLWVAVTAALQAVALRFCPAQMVVSDTCTADWYPLVDQLAMCAGAAAAALAMVALPTLMAPASRERVSLLCFSVGGLLALCILMAFRAAAIGPFVSAVVMGGLAHALLQRGRRKP